jgi:hypothetical protein
MTRQLERSNKEVLVILKLRCEITVTLPTKFKESETGLIERTEEIAPEVSIATLTTVRDSACLASKHEGQGDK